MLGKTYDGQDCALARSLEVLGERWTLLVVRDAFFGVRHFDDFAAHLQIPRAVLSDRLRGLVDNEVLVKLTEDDRRGRCRYELTDAGTDLWPVVHALITWGSRHRTSGTRRYSHVHCGMELDGGGACPSCAVTPGAGDVVVSPRSADAPVRTDPVTAAMGQPHRLLRPLDTSRRVREFSSITERSVVGS